MGFLGGVRLDRACKRGCGNLASLHTCPKSGSSDPTEIQQFGSRKASLSYGRWGSPEDPDVEGQSLTAEYRRQKASGSGGRGFRLLPLW